MLPNSKTFQIGTVLIDDNSNQKAASLLFENPIQIISANSPNEVLTALKSIETATQNGKYLAGFFSFELGYCLEAKLLPLLPKRRELPLLWFGVYDGPTKLKAAEIEKLLIENCKTNGFHHTELTFSLSEQQYRAKFERIHSAIRAGTIYQANLTFIANADFCGSALALYNDLRTKQKTKYGAYIDLGGFQILSRSPELFFEKMGSSITTIPMKGTAARGKTNALDKLNRNALFSDEKQRAENLMITDLMRNDLSRISNPKSVKVSKLFAIETYPTLFQMVSQINSHLKANTNISDIIRAIFPSGSITGAPKISAMEQINTTENSPRGIYCGAIGYIAPNQDAKFNVAIRTPIIRGGKLQMGIGSGIVYDSNAASEYQECLLKAKFLETKKPNLIETFLFQRNSGFARLSRHLKRLQTSANFLGISCDIREIENQLRQLQSQIKRPYARIRIEFGDELQITHSELTMAQEPMIFTLSPTIMRSNNPWLKHKTGNRTLYDSEWQTNRNKGFDEIVYCNEMGEITEGSRTNIFLDMGDGILQTPPLKCGLLPGILREELLELGQAKEKTLYLADLTNAKQIYLGNSLRGLKNAVFRTF